MLAITITWHCIVLYQILGPQHAGILCIPASCGHRNFTSKKRTRRNNRKEENWLKKKEIWCEEQELLTNQKAFKYILWFIFNSQREFNLIIMIFSVLLSNINIRQKFKVTHRYSYTLLRLCLLQYQSVCKQTLYIPQCSCGFCEQSVGTGVLKIITKINLLFEATIHPE